MLIRFISDFSVSKSGFSIKFKEIEQECGGLLTLPSGSIVSPKYPQKYENSLTCTWLIQAPEDKKIEVTFDDFNVEFDRFCR